MSFVMFGLLGEPLINGIVTACLHTLIIFSLCLHYMSEKKYCLHMSHSIGHNYRVNT